MDSLAGLVDLIDEVFPLAARYRAGLPADVAALSRQLTSARGDRDDGYLGKAAELSAYLRYFLPWNVFRLSRLLPALDLPLGDGDAVTDLGSGPLTLPIALWLSRPELRRRRLELRCLDRTGKVLEAGARLFAALAGDDCPWTVRTIRGSLGARIEGKPAALVSAVNVLNELFWDESEETAVQAERKAELLGALADDAGRLLIVEPGIPRSGALVSALRAAFLDQGRTIEAPCTHRMECPIPGGRRGAKWCHFAYATEGAPIKLRRLAEAAGIPKERATLSYLAVGPRTPASGEGAPAAGALAVRVISDAIELPNGYSGRYGCSGLGLTLLAGSPRAAEELQSGDLATFETAPRHPPRDPKTNAAVLYLD
jgi:hypothetical protein